ncbi:ABC transporter permease [Nonomuraea diastatica]|uniref:Transport permease protein n=1 Tax=Nonomuraea diastatica TaxID=1848329 RepID=A0A4V6PCY3_9ACTN|nr:ABC transporter permease [Nonomuraea diastatica]TDD15306.1 ABC transporter permease [Nonomuraea diastatica]
MGWWLADSWSMTRRELARWARQPAQVIVGLAFPVMFLVVFAYLLGGGMRVAGGGDYREFLIPGMFALTMAWGLEATMAALTQDLNKGAIDRFRSMPMAPSAVLVGRCIADMLQSVLGLAVMIGAGLAMGWRWHGSFGEVLAAVGLLLLLRFAMLWCGIWLGLIAGRPELIMSIQILIWPIVFTSGVLASPAFMPGWLGAIAEWNPITATAAAVRDLFGNPGVQGTSWAAENAHLLAVVWPITLVAVAFPMAAARFRALSR